MEIHELDEIILRIKGGDIVALDELFKNYFDTLVNFAIQIVKVPEDGEDIVSSFFVTLWNNRGKLTEIHSPKSFMYRAIKNACINHLKYRALSTKKHLEVVMKSDFTQIETEQKELNKIIEQTINNLPEQRKIIFNLIKVEGLKSKEVSEVMGVSTRTVENQLYRAVDAIATNLRSYLGYNPKNKILNHFLLMLY